DEFSIPGFYKYLVRLVGRHKWLILGLAGLVVVLTAAQLFTASPLYEAQVKLQVDTGLPSIVPYSRELDVGGEFRTTDAYLQTQREILISDSTAGLVIHRMGLTQDPVFNSDPAPGLFLTLASDAKRFVKGLITSPEPDAVVDEEALAVTRLKEGLSVRLIPGTRLVEIDYRFHNGEFAARIANTYADVFAEGNSLEGSDTAQEASDFLRVEVDKAREKLQASEATLINYSKEKSILNIDQNQEIARQRVADIDRDLTSTESKLLELRAEQRVIDTATPEAFPPSLENDATRDLESRLSTLQQTYSSLSAQFGRNWPETARTLNEIEELNNQLKEEKLRAIQRAREDFRISEEHYAMAVSRLRGQRQVADRLAEDLIEYKMLQNEVSSSRTVYEQLVQRYKEAQVTASLRSGNVRIIERAKAPDLASWPKIPQMMMMAAVIGLLFGFGVVLLMESFDDSITSAEDLEKGFGAACLGIIPEFGTSGAKGRLLLPGSGSAMAAGLEAAGHSQAAREAYRFLRTSIRPSDIESVPSTFLFTSALPNEGKTTTSVNTGITLASSGVRTLLVDLDLRNPGIGSLLNGSGGSGLSDFLEGESNLHSLLRSTQTPHLYFLPGGSMLESPPDLLNSKRLDAAFGILQKIFDVIIIDSPPVLPFTDALVLAGKVDEVVLVVKARKTSKDDVKKALSYLQRVDASLAGAVINGGDAGQTRYSQYYGRSQMRLQASGRSS
ncbi:MAG: polysaccharide biosynthesis tyrosine autokinase, partial [Acidobacteriota bacterium]